MLESSCFVTKERWSSRRTVFTDPCINLFILPSVTREYHHKLYLNFTPCSVHRRRGRHFTGGRKKFALKITICPESNFFSLIRMGPETSCKSVLYGFVCNVNSPTTLHFVRSRWHLSHAFQFAYDVISAITFFMQSPGGAVIGKFCSYLAC